MNRKRLLGLVCMTTAAVMFAGAGVSAAQTATTTVSHEVDLVVQLAGGLL